MKKILSVMLAIMMIFGAMSLSASAANVMDDHASAVLQNKDVVVMVFRFGEGQSRDALLVYDPAVAGNLTLTDAVTGNYYMFPGLHADLEANTQVQMPYAVTSEEGRGFSHWTNSVTGETYHPGEWVTITEEMVTLAHNSQSRGVIYLDATYYNTLPAEDTMAMILGILMKVFGTIIGILFLDGSSAAGVELVGKLLGGIL